LEVAQILVDAGAVERPPGSMGVVWQDQGDVTLKRNHRIVLVGRALADIAAGMRVDVGKHAKSAALAELPQGGVAYCMKSDGSAFVGVGVEIVVADERGHPAIVSVLRSQQECSALVAAMTPAAQLKD
jgi:hypothetical protein